MNCVEKHIQEKIKITLPRPLSSNWTVCPSYRTSGIHLKQGRGKCQARNLCDRGCPYGGYFSSNSTTLPWATETGNLTIRTDAVVHSIIYDGKKGKATGVRIMDANSKAEMEFHARIIFVNAACLNSNLILLNSTCSRFPNGFGNDNGLLGKYVAFHNYRGNINAGFEGYEDQYYVGRRPTAIMMPSFRNVHKQETDFLRGYMVFYTATRERGKGTEERIGAELKESMATPGAWRVFMMMQGETIPKKSNHVYLSPDKKDSWGIPLLVTSIDYDDNDLKSFRDFHQQGKEMLEKAGCKNIVIRDTAQAPGLDIHEMGGVRMGKDPTSSLLNKWNQFHTCKNVFVTDGAAMVSTGTQNPSLTFMAFTARAANYAVAEMKKGNL